jgi:PAS domain S-box-containing protein
MSKKDIKDFGDDFLKELVGGLDQAFFVLDANMRCVYQSKNFYPNEFFGESLLDKIIHKKELKFVDIFENVRDEAMESWHAEDEFIGDNEEKAYLELNLLKLFRAHEQLFLLTARDISKRKKSQLALEQSEKAFRALFDNVPDGIYRSDSKGNMIIANPAMHRMFGYDSLEEFLQINIAEDLYFDSNERKRWENLISSDGTLVNFELRLKKKDGSEIFVIDNARVTYDENKKVVFYEGILTDITYLKKATTALLESEANLNALLENTTDLIFSVDLNGEFLIMNPAAKKFFLETYGLNLAVDKKLKLERMPAKWLDLVEKALGGEVFSVEQQEFSGAGEVIFEISLNPIRGNEGTISGASVFAKDVTEKRKAARNLTMSEERYKALIENAPVGIVSFDKNGKILNINSKIVEILGAQSAQQVMEINMFDSPALEKAGILADIRLAIDEQRTINNENKMSSRWGKNIYLRYWIAPVFDNEGEIAFVQAIVEDISFSRRSSAQLFESYRYLAVVNRKISVLLKLGMYGATGDETEVLEFLSDAARELAGGGKALFYKLDEEGKTLTLLNKLNTEKSYLNEITLDNEPEFKNLIESRNRIQLRKFQGAFNQFLIDFELKQILALPLINKNEVIGVLIIGFEFNRDLTTQELDFFDVFTLQSGFALANTGIISS